MLLIELDKAIPADYAAGLSARGAFRTIPIIEDSAGALLKVLLALVT